MTTPNTPQSTKKVEEALQNKIAELLDSYFPDHKDCECSRCLAFIYGLKDTCLTILKETCEAALPEKKNGCSTHHSTVRPKMFCSSGECLANSNFSKAIDQTKANLNNLLGGDDE